MDSQIKYIQILLTYYTFFLLIITFSHISHIYIIHILLLSIICYVFRKDSLPIRVQLNDKVKWKFNSISVSKTIISACRHLSFWFPRKVTSKNFPPVSCFHENSFFRQSAKIRLLYHLGAIYTKWFALIQNKRTIFRIY